jgi:hypothetical protein
METPPRQGRRSGSHFGWNRKCLDEFSICNRKDPAKQAHTMPVLFVAPPLSPIAHHGQDGGGHDVRRGATMSRINDLRQKYAGHNPLTIPTDILREMLMSPYDGGEAEMRARVAIIDGKKRGTLNYAVRAKCLDCVGWSQSEVSACVSVRCPLWAFRMGDNPYRQKRKASEKQLAALRANTAENCS